MAKGKTPAQTALKIVSGVAILLFLFYLLLTLVLGGTTYFMINIEDPQELAATVAQYGVEGGTDVVISTLKFLSYSFGAATLIYLLMVIFGFRAYKKPKHCKPLIFLLALSVVLGVVNIIHGFIAEGMAVDVNIALNLAELLFMATSLYLVIKIYRDYKEGEIPAEEAGSKTDLGFISVIYFLFIVTVIAGVISLMADTQGDSSFDFLDVVNTLNIIFDAVSVWLIHQRSKGARGWIIGFSAFNIVAQIGYAIFTGDVSLSGIAWSCAFDIFLILYFCLARRPKEALIEDFSLDVRRRRAVEDRELWQPKTWAFWRTLIIYFIIFSVVGHWMEAGYCTLIKWGIMPGTYDPNSGIWHNWLYPFPVYGFGMCACGLLLFPIKNFFQSKFKGTIAPLICSYLVNAFVCGAIELTMGLMLNQPVNGVYPLWDYSNMFMNLWGQICLVNTSLFGLVATLMTWVVYPALTRFLRRLPEDVNNLLFVETLVFYAIVMSLYAINIAM